MRREFDYLLRISKNNGWQLAENEGRYQLQFNHCFQEGDPDNQRGRIFVHSDWLPAAEMTTFLREFYLNVPPSVGEKYDHNDSKASFAASTLEHYIGVIGGAGETMETTIGDLLADLAHYCDRHGLDFPAARTSAADAYAEETEHKGCQFDAELPYDPTEPNGLNPEPVERCRDCQAVLDDDGEGYDGRCGNCADKAEKEKATK